MCKFIEFVDSDEQHEEDTFINHGCFTDVPPCSADL